MTSKRNVEWTDYFSGTVVHLWRDRNITGAAIIWQGSSDFVADKSDVSDHEETDDQKEKY